MVKWSEVRRQKRAFRAYRARARRLPEEYRIVFQEMEKYLFQFAMDGQPERFSDLVSQFEAGAAEGKEVLDITGDDVIGFCDDLIREWMSRTWQDQVRERFNQRIHARLSALKRAPGGPQ